MLTTSQIGYSGFFAARSPGGDSNSGSLRQVRLGVLIGSIRLAVALAAAPALADDASTLAPAAGGPTLVIGGPDASAALTNSDSATDGSFLLGLERYLSQTRFTVGTNAGN